jgi:hypothetical protein
MSALLKPAVPSSTEMLEAFGRLFCLGIGCGAGAGTQTDLGAAITNCHQFVAHVRHRSFTQQSLVRRQAATKVGHCPH